MPLCRFDMNIRRASVNGVKNNARNEFSNRSIVIKVKGLAAAVEGLAAIDRLVHRVAGQLLTRRPLHLRTTIDVRTNLPLRSDARLFKIANAESQELKRVNVHGVMDD